MRTMVWLLARPFTNPLAQLLPRHWPMRPMIAPNDLVSLFYLSANSAATGRMSFHRATNDSDPRVHTTFDSDFPEAFFRPLMPQYNTAIPYPSNRGCTSQQATDAHVVTN